jgi:hypothetical protein
MNERLVLYAILYKVACLATGLACVVMGYGLFMAGIMSPESLKAAGGSNSLELTQAAPGTLFALFGCVVIAVVVRKGLGFDLQTDAKAPQTGLVHVQTLVADLGHDPTAKVAVGSDPDKPKGAGKAKAPHRPTGSTLHVAAR